MPGQERSAETGRRSHCRFSGCQEKILVNENDSQTILDKSAEKIESIGAVKHEKENKNLRQKIILAFIITACIPLVIFALISQERLKTSTLENMNNQTEADLQKANQSLNMTLDKYETLLYAITTDEEFLRPCSKCK